jgi:trehalose 6-phosphate phosphatase
LQHLLLVWPDIVHQLRNASHILLLSDFDGTLTPIVDKPELAMLSVDMRKLLEDLARQPKIALGVISGRALTNLKTMVGIKDILYVGNHGIEIEGPVLNFEFPGAAQKIPLLKILKSALDRSLALIAGVFVENKGFGLSVHYRLADEQKTCEIENIVKKVVMEAVKAGLVVVISGKKVFEVRLKFNWSKGEAIKYLIKAFDKGSPDNGLYPMYFGDDQTDEDGFKVVNTFEAGLSVLIGEETQQSAAHYFLKSTEEFGEFLSVLLEQAKKWFI